MEREEKLMKSNKWKFLLTGVATLTLLTACTQASSQSATTNNTAQTTATSTSNSKTDSSKYFTVLLVVDDCDDAWVQAVSKVRVATPVNKNFHLFDFMSFSSRSIDMLLV